MRDNYEIYYNEFFEEIKKDTPFEGIAPQKQKEFTAALEAIADEYAVWRCEAEYGDLIDRVYMEYKDER